MPCNGVAVATGQLPAGVEQILSQLDPAIVDTAVLAWLQSRSYQAEVINEYVRGRYWIEAYQIGLDIVGDRVTVGTYSRRRSWGKLVDELETGLTGLLTGLAGLVMQQQTAMALIYAGVQITGKQTAPNGAIVMEVEL